jgi:hypothetical protein
LSQTVLFIFHNFRYKLNYFLITVVRGVKKNIDFVICYRPLNKIVTPALVGGNAGFLGTPSESSSCFVGGFYKKEWVSTSQRNETESE